MDQSAALGGVMILVIAALWVLVFIPSWFQNRITRQENRLSEIQFNRQVKQLKASAKRTVSKVSLQTDRSRRLSRTKNLMSVMVVMAFLITATSAFFAVQFPPLFVASGIGLLVGIFTMLVALKASNELRKLLFKAAASRTDMTATLAKSWQEPVIPSEEPVIDPRSWTPNPLPSPAYRSRVGQLSIPEVATVVEIDQSRKNFDTQNEINEILRKRRATA